MPRCQRSCVILRCSQSSSSSPCSRSRSRLRLVRGRLAPDARPRGSRSTVCPRRSTGCGSATSPTSTSERRSRAETARARARLPGSPRGGPTSSASPATSSPIRVGSRACGLLGRLERPYVILGNHDVAVTRDPFSRAAELRDLEQARLLRDDAEPCCSEGRPSRSSASTPRRTASGRRARTRVSIPPRRCRCSSATSPVSSPVAAGLVRPDPRGPSARRADLPAAPGRLLTLAHPRATSSRALPTPGRHDARLARDGDELRAPPVLRPAGGDGARPQSARASTLD